jgi:hypothetical protein
MDSHRGTGRRAVTVEFWWLVTKLAGSMPALNMAADAFPEIGGIRWERAAGTG